MPHHHAHPALAHQSPTLCVGRRSQDGRAKRVLSASRLPQGERRRVYDPTAFIAANLRLAPAPAVPEILLHIAHPGSGLSRIAGRSAAAPYWAYPWPGGAALARHVLAQPETVAGRRVLDFGAGSGIVGIAAAKAGAAAVIAAEIDPNALAALGLNAAANGISIATIAEDLLDGAPPAVDIVLVGDLFYAADLAARVTAFLDRCHEAGIAALVGDPGRAHLPRHRLRLVACHAVREFGACNVMTAGVYAFAARPDRRVDGA